MSSVQIAEGHNNEIGLEDLEDIDPPLFLDFATEGGVLTEWHPYVMRERAGNGVYVEIGRPWVAWLFQRMTKDELATLLDDYGDFVTISTLDKSDQTFKSYNATFVKPDLVDMADWDQDGWDDVRLEFHDLVEI
jgi:hypothetical protein